MISRPLASARNSLRTTRASFWRSWSQNRITRHPLVRNSRVFRRSRRFVRSSFGRQYARFDFGTRPCSGQQCQKHPSTKIATFSRRKAKSGRPIIRWCRLQPAMPFLRKISTRRISVASFPVPRIRAITAERVAIEKVSATEEIDGAGTRKTRCYAGIQPGMNHHATGWRCRTP